MSFQSRPFGLASLTDTHTTASEALEAAEAEAEAEAEVEVEAGNDYFDSHSGRRIDCRSSLANWQQVSLYLATLQGRSHTVLTRVLGAEAYSHIQSHTRSGAQHWSLGKRDSGYRCCGTLLLTNLDHVSLDFDIWRPMLTSWHGSTTSKVSPRIIHIVQVKELKRKLVVARPSKLLASRHLGFFRLAVCLIDCFL